MKPLPGGVVMYATSVDYTSLCAFAKAVLGGSMWFGGTMCFGGFYVFWGFYVVVSQLIELKFCMFTCNNPAEGDAGILKKKKRAWL